MKLEIFQDAFFRSLQGLARRRGVRTILEIGSGSGNGSTVALTAGIREGRTDQTLWCLEADPGRFADLQESVRGFSSVRPCWGSSVTRSGLPAWSEVEEWWDRHPGHFLHNYGREAVRGWWQADADSFSEDLPQGLVATIMEKEGLAYFDLVLIDGSEFTGAEELRQVYGSRWIALDDVRTYKNWKNREILKGDSVYRLWKEDLRLRHGFSIFKIKKGHFCF